MNNYPCGCTEEDISKYGEDADEANENWLKKLAAEEDFAWDYIIDSSIEE